MMKRKIASVASLLLLMACNTKNADIQLNEDTTPQRVRVNINTDSTLQTVQNFGASDAWSLQFVGKNWPENKRNYIADLLFSTDEKAGGSPEGIGLSAWRFNIGAGSMEQGEASKIGDEWRRAPSFLKNDGSYDWTSQEGQLWFLNSAKDRGVETFIGFVNSPPVSMTRNGMAWSDDGARTNLPEQNYTLFADFLAEVVKGIQEQTAIELDYISPFNEPQWDWKCCGQEGSPWNNREIADMVRILDETFVENQVNSKIEITESGKLNYLYESADKPNRGNQIETFFSPASELYIGDLPSVASKIAAHSYFTTWDNAQLTDTRNALRQKLETVSPALEYWMSEYTLLEDNPTIKGPGRDLGMAAAMYMARVIHADLTIAQASAWHWWLAVSPYDYKDGLVYIDHNKYDGTVYESKMLWTLGHYSRFIRPGFQRIDVSGEVNSVNRLLASAYKSPDDNRLVVVFTNPLSEEVEVELKGVAETFQEMSIYQTSQAQTDNLKFSGKKSITELVSIPARALVTCVIE